MGRAMLAQARRLEKLSGSLTHNVFVDFLKSTRNEQYTKNQTLESFTLGIPSSPDGEECTVTRI